LDPYEPALTAVFPPHPSCWLASDSEGDERQNHHADSGDFEDLMSDAHIILSIV
jgi:hypothetical protein